MEIVRAEITDAEMLAELNKHVSLRTNSTLIRWTSPNLPNGCKNGWQRITSATWQSRTDALSPTAYTEMTVDTTICGNCTWTEHIDERVSLHSCLIGYTKTYGRTRKLDWTYSPTTKMLSPFTRDTASESAFIEWKNDTYCTFDTDLSLMLSYT